MCLVLLLRIIATIFDLITLPLYIIIQRPWRRIVKHHYMWATRVDKNDVYSPIQRAIMNLVPEMYKGVQTVDDVFRRTVEKYAKRPCLGTREVKDESHEMVGGKDMIKYAMGSYHWKTFKEVDAEVEAIGKGLLSLGVAAYSNVVIFAETREEWLMTALACFRNCIIVCTIYATLGDEGIVHGITETAVSTVITSEELLPRLQKLIARLPRVTHIIYMKARGKSGQIPSTGRARVVPFDGLLSHTGSREMTDIKAAAPTPKDIAIIMYTSGSTGQPKGVVMTNANVVALIFGMADVLYRYGPNETFIGFLPLAHVMEIAAECTMMSLGVKIGYSSPFTLTDKGTALKVGTIGDASVLKPTIVVAVPLLLNRIHKAVDEAVASKNCLGRSIFQFGLDYKTYWKERGFTTPLVNRIIFRKTKQILGGQVKVIASGSAPLSAHTQRLLSNCLDCPIVQGYGLTETSAGATLQDPDDIAVGVVGPPLVGLYIRVVDWVEGGYSAKDKPNPRGEIVVGGPTVTAGYYKRPDLTQEVYEEINNIRWFHSGDIGELLPNGTVKIIDRKKDLVKLQYGEYVSLGKVEVALKSSPLVDNACVHGNSLSTFTVALIQPNEAALRDLARTVKIPDQTPLAALCENQTLRAAVTSALITQCTNAGLVKFEVPKVYHLCKEAWTPESELVTAALKIRRMQLQKFYDSDIKEMYQEGADDFNELKEGATATRK